MVPHRLPSLATLRLGAATGMPGNAEGKRPVKASRVEKPKKPAPPAAAPAEEPEMLLLTHLPRDVISKIVTQAALEARNAEVPASAICTWMRCFCTAGRMQGLPCDDYWYKLALAAFGVDPDTVDEPPPKWMRDTKRSLSWRDFFGWVCDAFFSGPAFLTHIKETFPGVLMHNQTQRELDETLTELMHYCTVTLARSRHLPTVEAASELLKSDWDLAMRGKRSGLYHFSFWPLMGLLLLRGAEPWTTQNYAALDHEVFVAMMATRGDELNMDECLSTDEAIRRIADAMARGASLNVACATVEDNPKIILTLQLAITLKNGEIIRWLLDRGATPSAPRKHFEVSQQFGHMRNLITSTVYDYDEWQVDWDTTKQLIDQLDRVFERLRDDPDVWSPSASFHMDGLQILDTAIDHMEANWSIDDTYHMPENSNLDDLEDGDFIRGPRARLYEAWMAARIKLYSARS